ncbi:PKD domain-containing protein [Ferruginibacter profundus]
MSKYVLLSVLLIALNLNISAQESSSVKVQASQKLTWDEQEPFVNGFARVLKNNKFSFINKAGSLINPLEFDGARNFNNHLAAVQKNNKWGFIDESGKVIIPFMYDIVYDFTENITGVFGNKRWWLINTKAQVMKALDITVFYGYKNGIAKIEKNGRYGTINVNGEITFNKEQSNTAITNAVPYHPSLNSLTSAITVCPENIDFEYGSFFNWQCYLGHVDSVGNTNVITLNPSPPTPNRHTLYNRVTPSAIDPYGLFPTNPPDGSNFALRLGNTQIGAEAEGATYVIRVPANDSNFSIKYDYAVVFEDPGHTLWSQPRFQVNVFDSAANSYVDCASFEYVSTANLPGFTRSTVDTGVIYKPWSTVFLSLRGYAGKTMYLEFKNADCVRRGHWGYSYIDVEKPCGQSIEMDYDCAPPHITHLTAPPGFQFYNWWDSAFTTLLATGQNAVLNPGPTINTTIWLEMVPFNNFGCLDTIPVKITGEFKAHFDLSDTLGLCAPHTFTFYNRDVPSTSAIWDFGDGTTGTGDTVTHTYALPGSYIVKLNVVLPGGCIGSVMKLVSVVQPAGSFSFNGGNLCGSQTVQFNAITSNADSLFWNFGDGTILHTTQDTVSHTYLTAGIYIPSLIIHSTGGCQTPVPITDTIRIEILDPGFISNQVKVCGSTTLNFSDTSHSYFGITSRIWDFGDGTTGSGVNVSHTYTTTGTYNVSLSIAGASGCNDNVVKPIYVKVNDMPVVSIVGDTAECQSVPVTFTSAVQSVDAISFYHWTCSNGVTGSSANITINFTTAGTYTLQLITATVNGCADTAVHTITIHPTPDVVQPPNQVLCNGDFAAAINFSGAVPGTIYNWTNTYPLIGLAASGTGNIASFMASSNGNSVANATIRVTPTANGCPGPFKTFLITVHPTPNVAQPADQTLCNNSATAAITFSGTVAGTTYQWTNNNTTIGLAASGAGNIPSFIGNSNGATVNTATITVTPMVNGCPGAAKIFTITVNPMPDVAQPADQQLCSGNFTSAINFTGPVAGTLYSWTNTAPIIGLAANGTGNIASFQAAANGNAVANATITVTASINGCAAPSKTFVITVEPTPNVVQPADQALCDNSNTTPITFSGVVNGTVYNWTNNNPSIGLVASGTGNIPSFTASSNGAATNMATITVTPTFNGCPGTPKTFTITVNPMPDVVQPANQQLCSGNFTSAINFSGPVAGTLYSWTNTNTIIGLAANGTGNIASFAASSNGANVAVATITVTPSTGGCSAPPKSFVITVNPTPDVVQPADQTLCDNSNTTAINFAGAVTGATYSWTNNNTSIGLAASGIGNIPSFTASSNGATINTATITVTPMFNGCPGTPKTFTIIVKPMPDVVQPADQALCSGNFTAPINFTGPVAGTVYAWTNTNTVIGLAASGTGNIASFQALSNGASAATATITVTASANGCAAPSKTFSITVNPTPDVVQPTDQSLCDNSNTAAINFTGAVTGATYSWTNSNTSIGLAASGTGNIPSFTASSNGATINTATITVTPMFNGCAGTPKTFTITVNPMPDVVQPADQALCSGNFTTPINFTGPVAGTLYSWTNNNTIIGLAANGTGNIASFQALSNGSTTATATITVTASGNGCAAPSKTFNITVNPTPDVVQPANQALCDNSTTAAINFTGAVSGAVYNWTNNNPSIGLAASGTGNIPSFAASSNGATVNTATITVIPTFNGCPGAPKTFTIVVNPMPDIVKPADQDLCNGNFTTPVNFTGSVAGTVYTWTNTYPLIGLAASGTGNIPSFQASSNGASVATATITVKGNANGCAAPVKTFTITANPTPNVAQPANQAVCNGATINAINFTGNVAGAVYNWTNNNPLIGIPATGAGNIASFTAVNNTALPITATITVVPASSNCPGTAKTFTITINPTPAVDATTDAVVCLGKTVQLNATGAAQYTWTPVDHLTCSTCANPVAKPVDSIVYKVKGTSSFGCVAYDSVVLNVIKPFKMKVSPDDTLCIGESTSMLASNANSYIWSPPTNLSGLNTANPSAKPSATIRYQVIGFDGHNCFADTGYVLITVGPKPKVNIGPDRTLATGTHLTLNGVTQNGPIIKWEWTPASELSCSDCPSPSTIVRNNSFYTVQVTNTFGCIAADTIFINSICKSAQVYIPNAFTPDNDGLNDILMVRGSGITVKSFRIFNRWGELVFEKANFYPNDPKYGWDGKVRGVPATPDVFVYTAEIFCDNGIPYTYKGNITILK